MVDIEAAIVIPESCTKMGTKSPAVTTGVTGNLAEFRNCDIFYPVSVSCHDLWHGVVHLKPWNLVLNNRCTGYPQKSFDCKL